MPKTLGAWLLLVAAALSTILVSLALAAPALAEVIVSSKIVSYRVDGDTAAEVREQMIAKGPRKGVRPMYGHTAYNIRWSYRSQMVGGKCAVTGVKVTLSIVKTLPELTVSTDNLKAQFAEFRKRLDDHEEGHANNGRSMARRMERGIAALPPAPTCDELAHNVAALGKRLGDETTAADQEYDKRTGHSRTEGVIWPPEGLVNHQADRPLMSARP
jgi:predicted secreted Zn-dependent protease